MKEHLDELLDNERFELFVITTHDGFSIDKPRFTLFEARYTMRNWG